MKHATLALAIAPLLLGCGDLSQPVSGPAFQVSSAWEDSTSARALNRALLSREDRAIRMPSPPTPARAEPSKSRRYIIGFRGFGTDPRGEDQAILQSVGAGERYYFYGFRATSAYLDSAAVAQLRVHRSVTWIDSSTAVLAPLTETTGWSFTKHHFDQAHSAGYFGVGDVRVAIIGNGVQCSLDDLTCGTGVDITGEPNVDAGSSHETYIASIIAAAVGNGIGIKGGAPDVSLHSIRATDAYGDIGCLDLAEAIDVAAAYWELDADIVNLSYAALGVSCPSADSALAYAVWDEGVIIVAAAGNDGVGQVAYPASSALTIAVSAMKLSPFKIAAFSNYGSEIDIAAGGQDVKALDRTGAVTTISGTSFAVPHVVAALALLYGQKLTQYGCKPDADEAEAALYDNTQDPAPPFMASWYGAGALDIGAALSSNWVQYFCPDSL